MLSCRFYTCDEGSKQRTCGRVPHRCKDTKWRLGRQKYYWYGDLILSTWNAAESLKKETRLVRKIAKILLLIAAMLKTYVRFFLVFLQFLPGIKAWLRNI
jgi:hypothetical protein